MSRARYSVQLAVSPVCTGHTRCGETLRRVKGAEQLLRAAEEFVSSAALCVASNPPPRTTQYMALQGRYMLSRASNAVHLAPAAHSVPAGLSISIVDKSPSPAFLLFGKDFATGTGRVLSQGPPNVVNQRSLAKPGDFFATFSSRVRHPLLGRAGRSKGAPSPVPSSGVRGTVGKQDRDM